MQKIKNELLSRQTVNNKHKMGANVHLFTCQQEYQEAEFFPWVSPFHVWLAYLPCMWPTAPKKKMSKGTLIWEPNINHQPREEGKV